MERCSKPGCGRHGEVVLGYDYDRRRVFLALPARGELSPHLYALCGRCADRLSPPRGWDLVDERRVASSPDPPEAVERDGALAGAADVLFAS